MSLKEVLAKFREQQASAPTKVQVARPGKVRPPRTKPKSEFKPDSNTTTPQSSHWSDLVVEDASRHVPQATGLKIKRLLDALLEEEAGMSLEELQSRTGVNLTSDPALVQALQANPKTTFHQGRFSYQAFHNVKNTEELKLLLDKAPEGIPLLELEDAYKKIIQDIETLQESGRLYLLENSDTHDRVVYPADPNLAQNVDQDIQQLWRETQIPEDGETLTQELHKCGLKPCAKQKAPHVNKDKDEGKRNNKVKKLRSVQNEHVAEIFKDDMAEPSKKKARR
mmetsp:Transcript_32146/g.44573  ORF Transcript_32146/g.44573 Transcript_32146/m.44573 type:complete len:281 (-) Transcript_32146:62-904(-)|eukprot:CAMPEP_0196578072 /NCGR_PEP_ID=MMETSP1081-20130531/7054_1 /TAXON_ID=36882 /ORGANISM="Pyramimonas amylifera, Strain CCMP720" /LENGTH=280 /DNA_ID=CAMNT_0041897189 /DNA_START=78 /DNA_END=920 /DNA_ORIENTATION=+